jgi:hypothetical protein
MAEPIGGLPAPLPQQSEVSVDSQFEQMISLERERIEAQNRRTEVARLAVEASDRADERQMTFHIEKLKRDDDDRVRRYNLSKFFLASAGTFLAVAASLCLYMVFFGSDNQRETASTIMKYGFTALGGGGSLYLLRQAFRSMMGR